MPKHCKMGKNGNNQKPGTHPASCPEPASTPVAPWDQDAAAFWETLLSVSEHCAGMVDAQGVVRYVSPMCQQIFGLNPEEVVGRPFRELYADPHTLQQMLDEVREHGRIDHCPAEALRADGQSMPVQVTLVGLHDRASGTVGSLALIQEARHLHDLAHRCQQQAHELERLNRSLALANQEFERTQRQQSEFLANSYKLRTPLNAILSFLRLVLDGLCDNPAEEKNFINNAYDSARSLLTLINGQLDNAKFELGKLDPQLTEVNVGAVFAQLEKLARQPAEQAKVKLTVRPPRAQLLVRADPMKLQQILLELVTNALKFDPHGEVRVQARSWRDQGHVRFEVRDTGVGIIPELSAGLFTQTAQPEDPSTWQNGAAHPGLLACKNLVECMGGQIWLRSPGRDQGTIAAFTLPLVTPQPLYWRRNADRERGLEVQGPATGPLILMVEDEPKILDKMARILQKYGYRPAYAVPADDGLEGARRLLPALITLDLGLPVRPMGQLHSGMDLYRALQHDPHTAGLPVILVTGHDPRLSQATGPLPPILNKPFRAQELLDQVARLLAGASLPKAQGAKG
jgi:PAS domain S-box-containing protein